MRLDYINAIIDSAVKALTELTGGGVERGDMKLQRQSGATKEVATIIGMTGDVDGRIIIEMNKDTALAIAGIMNESSVESLDPMALDTLMELANIVAARAVSTLNDQGFVFRLTPPMIFTGADLRFFGNLDLETLVIPLKANAGHLNLNVALRMNSL